MTAAALDLVVRGGRVVFPGRGVEPADIGIHQGKVVAIASTLERRGATEIDARGKTVMPGVVDSHFHLGIFRELADDAMTETRSAVAGGVTVVLPYHRAGRNNLFDDVVPRLPASYLEIFPQLLEQARGHFWCDYGFNLAPVTRQQVREVGSLIRDHGVTTFKYYMHYRGVDPAAYSPTANEKEYVFTDTRYDLGHLRDLMRHVAEENDRGGARARVSVHSEDPGMIREHTRDTKDSLATLAGMNPLQLYSRSRPPEGEQLAIGIVAELAHQTGCPVNVLHISSAAALEAVRAARRRHPGIDILAESTVHHLSLANDELGSVNAKVNPPIRGSRDRDALWDGVRSGDVQTAVSDHAAIDQAHKGDDIWSAWYGFGGTELLLPALLTEGHLKRGIPLERIAEVLSLAPARYHSLSGTKGDIAIGHDADLAICDLERTRDVDHRRLNSAQDFSPFDGRPLRGWVDTTILRGTVVYQGGETVGSPIGSYLRRPV